MTAPVINRATRRRVFGAVGGFALGAVALGVSACGLTGGTASPAATVTQVLLDIQGGIGTLKTVVAGAAAFIPTGILGSANVALTSATNAFGSLTSTVANMTTATTLQTAEGFLSAAAGAVVAALTGVSGAAAYLVIAQTVAALLPAITAWITSVVSPGPVAAAAHDFRPVRGALGIPTLA